VVDNDYKDKFAEKYRIKSTRLLNWNYSTPGHYFITICTLNQNNFLGKIINEKIIFSYKGNIVKEELIKTFEMRKSIFLDEYIIMPNHVHLLINILLKNPVETHRVRLFSNKYNRLFSNNKTRLNLNNNRLNNIKTPNINLINRDACNASLQQKSIKSQEVIPNIIKLFKGSVSSRCKKESLFFGWQSRFYDKIIASEKEYYFVKEYIKNNPKNWQKENFRL